MLPSNASAHPRLTAASRSAVYLEVTKPRITAMVLLTVAAGFFLAPASLAGAAALPHVLIGALLSCSGAGALNQYLERHSDSVMDRTRFRPLPLHKVAPGSILAYGLVLSAGGVAYLAASVGLLTAAVDALTLGSYLFVYTPLKRVSPLSTLVGAVPGALPPLMGWTAATGKIQTGGLILFSILFLWQIPHFLAVGRLYKKDYELGGFPMLVCIDAEGDITGRQMVLYSLALLPVSMMPSVVGLTGTLYFCGALVLGLGYLAAAVAARWDMAAASSRRLLLASITYPPLLIGLMLADRIIGCRLRPPPSR